VSTQAIDDISSLYTIGQWLLQNYSFELTFFSSFTHDVWFNRFWAFKDTPWLFLLFIYTNLSHDCKLPVFRAEQPLRIVLNDLNIYILISHFSIFFKQIFTKYLWAHRLHVDNYRLFILVLYPHEQFCGHKITKPLKCTRMRIRWSSCQRVVVEMNFLLVYMLNVFNM